MFIHPYVERILRSRLLTCITPTRVWLQDNWSAVHISRWEPLCVVQWRLITCQWCCCVLCRQRHQLLCDADGNPPSLTTVTTCTLRSWDPSCRLMMISLPFKQNVTVSRVYILLYPCRTDVVVIHLLCHSETGLIISNFILNRTARRPELLTFVIFFSLFSHHLNS